MITFNVDFNEIIKAEQLIPISSDMFLYYLKPLFDKKGEVRTDTIYYLKSTDLFYRVIYTSNNQKTELIEENKDYFEKYRSIHPPMNQL